MGVRSSVSHKTPRLRQPVPPSQRWAESLETVEMTAMVDSCRLSRRWGCTMIEWHPAPGTRHPAPGVRGVAASSTSDPRRALALLAVLGGCGPGIRQADDGSGSGEQETSTGEAGTNSAEGSSAAASSTGTGEVACPEGEYCFERFDLREIGSPSQLAAGNLDDEPGLAVCGQSRPFNPATGSL